MTIIKCHIQFNFVAFFEISYSEDEKSITSVNFVVCSSFAIPTDREWKQISRLAVQVCDAVKIILNLLSMNMLISNLLSTININELNEEIIHRQNALWN